MLISNAKVNTAAAKLSAQVPDLLIEWQSARQHEVGLLSPAVC